MSNQKISWRLCRGNEVSALSADQIEDLSIKFDLPVGSVTQLGADLVWALGAGNGPRSVSWVAEAKGTKVFKAAVKDLAKAAMLLERARERLRLLSISDELEAGRYVSAEAPIFALLIEAHAKAEAASDMLKDRADAGMSTRLRGLGDARRDMGSRRSMVCTCIMTFWQSVERKVSYTTDHDSSDRGGQLIDFINAVTAYVTAPSRKLNGETLRKEIDQFKALQALERKVSDAGV